MARRPERETESETAMEAGSASAFRVESAAGGRESVGREKEMRDESDDEEMDAVARSLRNCSRFEQCEH